MQKGTICPILSNAIAGPVDADQWNILHWCKMYRCKVIASNACSSNETLLRDKRVSMML